MIILDVPNWIVSFTWFSFGCLMLAVAGGIGLIISGPTVDFIKKKFNKK
tara:strand:+ start:19112 stop:19258 length:147 start_codon:yes stop_codon:yes gene_type:complete